jgi:hypothetical protein
LGLRCCSVAARSQKKRGIEKVMGTVLAQKYANAESREKIGFKINKVLGAGEYELSL